MNKQEACRYARRDAYAAYAADAARKEIKDKVNAKLIELINGDKS